MKDFNEETLGVMRDELSTIKFDTNRFKALAASRYEVGRIMCELANQVRDIEEKAKNKQPC